jgi:hypothetical protein
VALCTTRAGILSYCLGKAPQKALVCLDVWGRGAHVYDGCRYQDGALDLEMIEDVRRICLELIEKQGEMPLSVLATELTRRGFSNLSHTNVHEVLSALVYDGLVCNHGLLLASKCPLL